MSEAPRKIVKKAIAPEKQGELFPPSENVSEVQMAFFKSALRIDKNNLDDEFIRQPQQFSDVTDALALAESQRDMLKDDLKTSEAQLSITIRSEKDLKGEKTTEATIKELVQVDTRRRKVYTQLVAADRMVAELQGYREAWKDRSFMLRSLSESVLSQNAMPNSHSDQQSRLQQDARAASVQQQMAAKRMEARRNG